MLYQLPHHRTVGRHPDPPIGLLGDKPAQYGKAARARLEGGLATRKGRIVIGEPTFGQRLAKAAFHFRPKEPFGLADIRLAQTGLADQQHPQTLGHNAHRGPGAHQIARHHRIETVRGAAGAADPRGGGRPRKIGMRAAMNAIPYSLRTGRPGRYLPRDRFPPRSMVYNMFRRFQRDGVWPS